VAQVLGKMAVKVFTDDGLSFAWLQGNYVVLRRQKFRKSQKTDNEEYSF
jgi:hypothetical protein